VGRIYPNIHMILVSYVSSPYEGMDGWMDGERERV